MPITTIGRTVRRLPDRAHGFVRAALSRFVRDYYAHVGAEDLAERTPENLLGAALSHLKLGCGWTAGHRRVRVFNPDPVKDGFESTHTIVQFVTADRPFLVDSVTMALNRLGFTVHLVVHPILYVTRGKNGEPSSLAFDRDGQNVGGYESFTHVEIDRETDTAQLLKLETSIEHALEQARVAVEDWQPMVAASRRAAKDLAERLCPVLEEDVTEARAFLDWLADENFTFLGYREFTVARRDGHETLRAVPRSGLGILRRTRRQAWALGLQDLRILGHEGVPPTLIVCTKSSFPSDVHRPGYMDRISLFRFNLDGTLAGEQRILGLYTSRALLANPRRVPLLSRKIEWVLTHSGFASTSHAGKSLLNILDTYPREELFQASPTELLATATGILQLQERQRVRLFLRRDPFGRYLAGMVFVPRDRLDTSVRERIAERLVASCAGTGFDYSVSLTEAPLARVYFIIHTQRGKAELPAIAPLEHELEHLTRSWSDKLHQILLAHFDEETANETFARYRNAFPAGYQEDHRPEEALDDIVQLEAAAHAGRLTTRLQGSPTESDVSGQDLNLKLFHVGTALPLSTVVPMLENLGVLVWSESSYEVSPQSGPTLWLHDFVLRTPDGVEIDLPELDARFRDAVHGVWNETLENDELNQLVLRAGLSPQQVVVVRTYTKYIRQIGGPFGQRYIAGTLARHPHITGALVNLFEMRFRPELDGRAKMLRDRETRMRRALDDIPSLDEDRILRRYFQLILATLRTNYFQRDHQGKRKPCLSIKLDPSLIEELPEPRPRFEIFVYSARVEGIHLRGGEVARGGLRWSDRREDFRTEVLGLMKAQMVKNSVIVPVGAKGGFFVKRPPTDGGREALRAEGVACYKTFLRGMLDITDNRIAGKIVPPPAVVRYDGDDPYLVVAADKGTATFSDIANEVSAEYDFWLDDAFASGGSNGYDHKVMAITARGAWESVKHHFQRLGTDVQSAPITVVGIGDMSGDVFGNGVLLSPSISLVAAFDHRHIFIDPNPDPAASLAERRRLAELTVSSWDDYDRGCLSVGGDVFPRTAKTLRLSGAARKALGVKGERFTPDALIQAVLRAPVDLFWNGGIGTYVKASAEDHASVGDRTNDSVRIDASQVRFRAIGEGGNLGISQPGRVQYAGLGGLINADWIDNSAGVHCSDLEVNIKIFLRALERDGKLGRRARDRLLACMTEQVAARVLASNYRQARALTLAEAESREHLSRYARLIASLERDAGLDRKIEAIPNARTLERRTSPNDGLRRPELAVLLAYAKNFLYRVILDSTLPHDPYLHGLLERYFPDALRRHRASMRDHQLRAEIVSTVLANSIVNRAGPAFAHQLAADTGCGLAQVAGAYLVARDTLALPAVWDAIDREDYRVGYPAQAGLQVRIQLVLARATHWLLRHRREANLSSTAKRITAVRLDLDRHLQRFLPESERLRLSADTEHWCRDGVPKSLAEQVARLPYLYAAFNLQDVLARGSWPVETAAGVYFRLGERLRIVQLQHMLESLPMSNRWQDRAGAGVADELSELQMLATVTVLRASSGDDPEAALERWFGARERAYENYLTAIPDASGEEPTELAMLTVVIAELRSLLESAAEVGPTSGKVRRRS
ncbi:MAG: glutamate dehydrogenase [Gammaproteobacteria bacterium]|jgi:glutamate dehydrogenase